MATLDLAGQRPGNTALYRAAAVALAVELALLGGACLLLRQRAAPPPQLPLIMQLAAPSPIPSAPPAPAPVPVPQPVPAPATRPVQPRHEMRRAAPVKKIAPQLAPTPPAAVNSAAPVTAPPAPPAQPAQPVTAPARQTAPAPTTADPTFENELRAALQAALQYPEAARMSGMTGRTRVAFRYRDGSVSDVSVVVSSGSAMLDHAALAAVHSANYPRPRLALAGKTLSTQLWITFSLKDNN